MIKVEGLATCDLINPKQRVNGNGKIRPAYGIQEP
jgi:hypothetical protein